MKILFLDLASNSPSDNEGACIACVTEKSTEAIEFVDHRVSDNGIVPLIESALKKAGWTLKDLTHIACVNGPGGFTSLRMAVALANVYADQLKLPVAAVHLSELWNARSGGSWPVAANKSHQPPATGIVWLHSTKKTQLFVRGGQWTEPTLVSLEDILVQLPEGAHVTGEVIPEHRAALEAKNVTFVQAEEIADVLPAFLSSLPYKEEQITPWYGRGW